MFPFYDLGQLYDVITDYIFLFAMVDESNNGLNPPSNIDVLIAIGAGSVGAAFLINLLLTAYILLRERRRPAFAKVGTGDSELNDCGRFVSLTLRSAHDS